MVILLILEVGRVNLRGKRGVIRTCAVAATTSRDGDGSVDKKGTTNSQEAGLGRADGDDANGALDVEHALGAARRPHGRLEADLVFLDVVLVDGAVKPDLAVDLTHINTTNAISGERGVGWVTWLRSPEK